MLLRSLPIMFVIFDVFRSVFVLADDFVAVFMVLIVFLFPQVVKAYLGIFLVVSVYCLFAVINFGPSMPTIAGLFFHFKFILFYAVFRFVFISERQLDLLFAALFLFLVANFIVYAMNVAFGTGLGNLDFYNGNLRFGSLMSNAGRMSAIIVMVFTYYLFVRRSITRRIASICFLLLTFVKKDFWILMLLFGRRASLALAIPSFSFIAYIIISEYAGQSYEKVARYLLWYFPISTFSQDATLMFFGWGPGTWGGIISGVFYSDLYYRFGVDGIWGMMPDQHTYISDGNWPSIFGEMGLIGVAIYTFILRRIFIDITSIRERKYRQFGLVIFFATLIQSIFLVPFMTSLYYIGCFMVVPMLVRRDEAKRLSED